LPINIFPMLLPATCACPQTARCRASGVLRLDKILLTIQVEWRIVKLFDRAYNAIIFYCLEAFLAVFRITPDDFSVARRFSKPFVFFALSGTFTVCRGVQPCPLPPQPIYYVYRPALRGASLVGAAPWLVLTSPLYL